jgi:hypothetical protein
VGFSPKLQAKDREQGSEEKKYLDYPSKTKWLLGPWLLFFITLSFRIYPKVAFLSILGVSLLNCTPSTESRGLKVGKNMDLDDPFKIQNSWVPGCCFSCCSPLGFVPRVAFLSVLGFSP